MTEHAKKAATKMREVGLLESDAGQLYSAEIIDTAISEHNQDAIRLAKEALMLAEFLKHGRTCPCNLCRLARKVKGE